MTYGNLMKICYFLLLGALEIISPRGVAKGTSTIQIIAQSRVEVKGDLKLFRAFLTECQTIL
jgi:hypothetical protein